MICAALICACNATFADTIIRTFYGAEASDNPNNPCKGALITICGKITTTAVTESDYSTKVEMTTSDADDNVTYHTVYIDPRPLAEVLKDFEWEKTGSTGTIMFDRGGSNDNGSDDNND